MHVQMKMYCDFCENILASILGLILFSHTQVYVLKRPHVDEFLKRMGELFECVLFTASLAKVSRTSVI